MNRYPQPVLATLVLSLASTGALATDLFRIEAEAAKSLPTQERAWTVAVDPKLDLAGSDHLMLNLPGHAPIRAERLDHRAHEGGHTWHGRAGGKPVTVTMHEGRLHGDFLVGLDHYTISSERGRTTLSLANRFEAPRDELTPAPKATTTNAPMPAPRAKTTAVDIRILVAYTDAVLAASGSAQDVASAAQFMIGQLNGMFTRSVAADIRFTLAGMHRVDYADGLGSDFVLQRLSGDSSVAAERDAKGADIVVLLVENTDFSGRAYMPNTVHVGNASVAFAVVTRSYGLNYYTFAHEVGHVMGLDHGGGSAGAGAFPWGQGHVGYVDSAGGYPEGFVTVMANIGLCGGSPPCHHVPYFSNPELTDPEPPVRGRALGEADVADSARALRDAAATVAMYRPDPVDDVLLYANFEESDALR